jgi:hypothetical protein
MSIFLLNEGSLETSPSASVSRSLTYLNVGTIGHNLVLPPQCLVIGPVEGSETPLLGNDNLLPSWELVSSSSECLHDDGSVLVSASDGHDDLTTVCQLGSRAKRVR